MKTALSRAAAKYAERVQPLPQPIKPTGENRSCICTSGSADKAAFESSSYWHMQGVGVCSCRQETAARSIRYQTCKLLRKQHRGGGCKQARDYDSGCRLLRSAQLFTYSNSYSNLIFSLARVPVQPFNATDVGVSRRFVARIDAARGRGRRRLRRVPLC